MMSAQMKRAGAAGQIAAISDLETGQQGDLMVK